MMHWRRGIPGALLFCCLAVLALDASVAQATMDDFLAVAYTQPNYQGVSWTIEKAGRYNLPWLFDARADGAPMVFALPNDSIASIRVRPGCTVTLYEHGTFEGKSRMLEDDTHDLGEWGRRASSLEAATGEAAAGEIAAWVQAVGCDARRRTAPVRELNDTEIADVLAGYEEEFLLLRDEGEGKWYGNTTDEQRVEVGEFLIRLFGELGYDVSGWTPNSFAQQMNNFYDWRKDLSIWRTACLVPNIDAEKYETVFNELEGIK
jgi:hypothetical protein